MPPVPNFLCIGAQRAGTTWLAHNLRQHPLIWMPPVKELHFFDAGKRTPLILHAFETQTISGKRTRFAARCLRQHGNVGWVLRYLLIPRVDRWYPLLFMPGPQQVCGEVTPGYARLDRATIQRVKTLLPDLKLIYLLRDPVQCAWSQISSFLSKAPTIDVATMTDVAIDKSIRKNLDRLDQHSNYLGNLQRWETIFQRPVFVGFFQQIVEEPEALLTDIFGFLGVDTSATHIPADVRLARNSRTFRPMPAVTAFWLTERLYPQIVGLHERFRNSYTAEWLATAEQRLSLAHTSVIMDGANAQ